MMVLERARRAWQRAAHSPNSMNMRPKPDNIFRRKIGRESIANSLIWGAVVGALLVGAWFTNERVLYVAAVVLLALPLVSLVFTLILLRAVRVAQDVPLTIVKNQSGAIDVRLRNMGLMPFSNVELLVTADENAIIVEHAQAISLNPLERCRLEIPFCIEFRGFYRLGVSAVQVTDMTGLFKLRRKLMHKPSYILCLPLVTNMQHFPISANLTQAASRFDIRDEDYTTISEIRQYRPTDSIKRVHWKLTAKRNEWLVKVFQSNALNRVSIILDSAPLPLPPREKYALEDCMVETAVSLAKFCLTKDMPIDFFSEGKKATARALGEFDAVYKLAAELTFDELQEHIAPGVLTQVLSETTGFVNALMLTPHLTPDLLERVLKGANTGHFIAVLYFENEESSSSEEVFKLMSESKIPCYRFAPQGDSYED